MVTKNPLRNKRILVTCGPTWVPLDSVRVISNTSSGELGHLLVQQLIKQGAVVTLLEGPTTHPLQCKPNRLIKFTYYDELAKRMKQEIKKKHDVVFHAAAVSDYELKKVYKTKLKSNKSRLNLKLTPTKKIIESIKKSNNKVFLVGFKLETKIKKGNLARAINALVNKAKCDLVVVNSASTRGYEGCIIDKKRNVLACAKTRQGIVNSLIKTLKKRI